MNYPIAGHVVRAFQVTKGDGTMNEQQHLYDPINQVTHRYLEELDAAAMVVRAIDSLSGDGEVIEATMNLIIETFGLKGFNSLTEDDTGEPKTHVIQLFITRMERDVAWSRRCQQRNLSALSAEERLVCAVFGAQAKKGN